MQLEYEGVLSFPWLQWVQDKTMLGDQENSTLTAEKTKDWLIIYSVFI